MPWICKDKKCEFEKEDIILDEEPILNAEGKPELQADGTPQVKVSQRKVKYTQPFSGTWLDILFHYRKDGSVHQDLWCKNEDVNYNNAAERMTESEILKYVKYVPDKELHKSDNVLEDDIPAVPEDEIPEEVKESRKVIEKGMKKK